MRKHARLSATVLGAIFLTASAHAKPQARFAEITYSAMDETQPEPGNFRNPVLPGFHPDPALLKVGGDFYLVTSTFGWYPGIPVFHSRDLVNWKLIGHAIDRPSQLDLSGLKLVTQGVYAPTINYHNGTYYIFNTCVGCRDNFYLTAKDPKGPWSDPVWLDFAGIDPSIFFDDDGKAWVINNDLPEGGPTYEGHRALWVQQIDLAAGKMVGSRTMVVNGGGNPDDKPIWAEGPHIFKKDGWYYINSAEGGTAEDHSQTIYRSRSVTGPYVAGPTNPTLTQRDLPRPRPEAVEATGHADLVELDDGSWWATFLATRPFAGQSTLLGRETWLLPVEWRDGWPIFLDKGKPVPWENARPDLPSGYKADWTKWTDSFEGSSLSPEWLEMRTPVRQSWYALDKARGDLVLDAGVDAASTLGKPHFLGRRMRHPMARWTTRFSFMPEGKGDLAGLMAFADEAHFLVAGIEQDGDGSAVVLRMRTDEDQAANGEVVSRDRLGMSGDIELRLTVLNGTAGVDWRPVGGEWRTLAKDVDVEPLASIHAGLFTGVMVGPYAVKGS